MPEEMRYSSVSPVRLFVLSYNKYLSAAFNRFTMPVQYQFNYMACFGARLHAFLYWLDTSAVIDMPRALFKKIKREVT